MSELNSPLEILKLLDKSNCKKCGKPTCLAFAADVFKGEKQLKECPNLEGEIIERYKDRPLERNNPEQYTDESVELLKRRIAATDLSSLARRLEAKYSRGRLTIKCLGKDFSVDAMGNIITDIHVKPWVTIPALTYILDGEGIPVSGKWIAFRELEGGKDRYPLFARTCEMPLRRFVDTHTNFFQDMLDIFNGTQVEHHYPCDISVVLHPLPKVPILICYSRPEEGFESSLAVLFDSTTEHNLNIECIHFLVVALVMMFEKLALTHG